MKGPPLGPGREDITWPDQVAPRSRKASSTGSVKPQTSNLSSLPSLLSPPPVTCLSPALLLLLSCSLCSPLLFPTPGLYLARSDAPLGLRPVLRPVGRLGRPPQGPLRGDSPVVRPHQPPLHYFPDGGPGRQVRLNAGQRHGFSLRETWCTFLPLLAPCVPLPPRGPATWVHLLFPPVAPPVALVAAHACPACSPCSPLQYPCLAALRTLPLPRHLPSTLHLTASLPAVTQRGVSCLLLSVHYCPLSLPLLFIHGCFPVAGFTYALHRCPYPFPWSWVVTSPCLL